MYTIENEVNKRKKNVLKPQASFNSKSNVKTNIHI